LTKKLFRQQYHQHKGTFNLFGLGIFASGVVGHSGKGFFAERIMAIFWVEVTAVDIDTVSGAR
jgi:hypothetical protein